MAFSHGSIAAVHLAGVDATGYIKSVSFDMNVDLAETTTLGKTAKTFMPGMESFKIKASGFHDSDVALNDADTFTYKLHSLHRTFATLSYMPTGDFDGYPAKLVYGILTSTSIATGTGDVASTDFDLTGSNEGRLASGLVLRGQDDQTGTVAGATSTGYTSPDGLSSSNGLVAILQVLSVAGTSTPTLNCKLQHSADSTNGIDGVWADVTGGAFTAATALGAQFIYTAPGVTIHKYVRINYTVTGTSPVIVFGVQFARS